MGFDEIAQCLPGFDTTVAFPVEFSLQLEGRFEAAFQRRVKRPLYVSDTGRGISGHLLCQRHRGLVQICIGNDPGNQSNG